MGNTFEGSSIVLLLLSAQKYYGLFQCPTLIYSVNTRVTKLLAQCY